MEVVDTAWCLDAPDIYSYFIWHIPLVCTVIHDLTFLWRFMFPWSPYIYIYICMRQMYIYMHLYMYIHIYITYICIYICIYTYTFM